jgi:hypothetical protein
MQGWEEALRFAEAQLQRQSGDESPHSMGERRSSAGDSRRYNDGRRWKDARQRVATVAGSTNVKSVKRSQFFRRVGPVEGSERQLVRVHRIEEIELASFVRNWRRLGGRKPSGRLFGVKGHESGHGKRRFCETNPSLFKPAWKSGENEAKNEPKFGGQIGSTTMETFRSMGCAGSGDRRTTGERTLKGAATSAFAKATADTRRVKGWR